ncbi:MAG TPA: KH domain-containing protein [Edaphobacter sp.]
MTQTAQPVRGNDSEKGMVDLVTEIARALVDDPDSVVVEAIQEQEGTVLRLHVAPSDVGKVIGKQGRTARSLRTILSAASMKMKHRYALDIVEEGETRTQS